jgi:hypothetical protein
MPGMERLNDGYVVALAPVVWDEGRIDYFYARMAAGTLLPEVNGGMYNEPEHLSESLAGWNRADWEGNRGVLSGGSQDSQFRLERFDPWPGGMEDWQVERWQVGTTVQGFISGFSDLDYSMMQADMRLDSIIVVPEPSAVSLLPLGGMVCVLWGRRTGRERVRPRLDPFHAEHGGGFRKNRFFDYNWLANPCDGSMILKTSRKSPFGAMNNWSNGKSWLINSRPMKI